MISNSFEKGDDDITGLQFSGKDVSQLGFLRVGVRRSLAEESGTIPNLIQIVLEKARSRISPSPISVVSPSGIIGIPPFPGGR